MRCDAEAACCGPPPLPSEHLHPMTGFHQLATSENSSPGHPETPALSTSTKQKGSKCEKLKFEHSLVSFIIDVSDMKQQQKKT